MSYHRDLPEPSSYDLQNSRKEFFKFHEPRSFVKLTSEKAPAKKEQILENEKINKRTRIYQSITNERARQDYLHPYPMADKSISILGEEFGEVCKADFEDDPEQYKKELVELAACCVRRLEEIL